MSIATEDSIKERRINEICVSLKNGVISANHAYNAMIIAGCENTRATKLVETNLARNEKRKKTQPKAS